ncbi:MAG: hypothetical protein ACP5NW_06105 [Candidatus Woesearchaeota archaeon]
MFRHKLIRGNIMRADKTEQWKREAELESKFTREKSFICNDGIEKNISVEGIKGTLTGFNPYLPIGMPVCKFYDKAKQVCTNISDGSGARCSKAITTTTYYKIDNYETRAL